MKNSVNRVTKKVLSFVLAVAMMFSVLSVAITALANEVPVVYTVTEAKPAIPVKQGKVVDLNKIAVELGGDTYRGTELEWSTNDTTGGVLIGNGIIAVLGSDTYTVEAVTNTGEKKTIYLFETDENGNKVIYDHTFSQKDLASNGTFNVFTAASEWNHIDLSTEGSGTHLVYNGGIYADRSGRVASSVRNVAFYLDPDSASGKVVSAFADKVIEFNVYDTLGGGTTDCGAYVRFNLNEDGTGVGKYVLASTYTRTADGNNGHIRYQSSEASMASPVQSGKPLVAGNGFNARYTIVGSTILSEYDLDLNGSYADEADLRNASAYTYAPVGEVGGTIGFYSRREISPVISRASVTVNFDISNMEEYFSDEEIYIVKADNAVLPMYEGQKLDLTKLFFEFDNGTVAVGSQIAWATKDATGGIKVNNTDKSIIMFNEGFYEVIAAYSKAGEPKTFYVATPDANNQVVIYNKTFTAEDFDANGYLTEESEWYSSYNDNQAKFTEKTGAYGLYGTNASTVIYLRPDSDGGKVVSSFRDITYEVAMRPNDQMNWWGYAAPIARVSATGVIDAGLANMTYVATYYSTLHPESAHTAQNHAASGQCGGIHNTMTTYTSVSAANSATVNTGIALPTNTTSKYKMVLKGDTLASYVNYGGGYVETTIALTDAQATAMASTKAGTIGIYSAMGYRAGIASVNVFVDVAQAHIDAIAARSSDIPLIPANKPYIPMEAKKTFDTTEVYFGFDSGKVVAGSDITWSTTDTTGAIKAEDSVITLFSGNFHEITATYGEETKTFYVVMPNEEGNVVLMDYQFSEADAGVTIADGSSAFIGENDTWEVISNGGGVTSSYHAGRGLGLHGNSSFFVLLNPESPYGKLVSGFTDVIIDVRADGQAVTKWANSTSSDAADGSIYIYGRFNSTNEIPGAPNNNKDTYVGYQQYFSNAVKGNVLVSKNATIPAAVLTTYDYTTSNYTIDMRLKLDGTTVTYWAKNGNATDFGEPLFTVTDSSIPTGKGTYGFYSSSMLRPTVKYFKVAIEVDEKQINTVAKYSSDLLAVSADKPAIPISVGKKVDVSKIYFEFDNGTVALGKDITWSTDDTTGGVMVADADKTIALLGGDVYAVNAKLGAESKTFYVMQPTSNGDKVIYEKTFKAEDVADGAFTADSEWGANISSSGSIIAYVADYSGVGVATSSGSIASDSLYGTLYLRPDSENGKLVSSFADMNLEVVTYQSVTYNGAGGYLGPMVRYDVANGKHILAQHRIQGGASPATESLKLSAARLIVNGDYSGTITAQSYILYGKAVNTITLAVNGNEVETAVNGNVTNLSINATQADGIAASTKGTIGFNFGGTNRSVLKSAKVTISFSDEEIAMFANPAITSDLLIVKSTAPALPLNAGKSLDVGDIFFEFDSGKVVSGSLIEWSSESTALTINNSADTITLIKDGNFELTASFGGESKTLYILQLSGKNKATLYEKTFDASDVADGSFTAESEWLNTNSANLKVSYDATKGMGAPGYNAHAYYILDPDSASGQRVSAFRDVIVDYSIVLNYGDGQWYGAAAWLARVSGYDKSTSDSIKAENYVATYYMTSNPTYNPATDIRYEITGNYGTYVDLGVAIHPQGTATDYRTELIGDTIKTYIDTGSGWVENTQALTDAQKAAIVNTEGGTVGVYNGASFRPGMKSVKVYTVIDEALINYINKNSTEIDIIPADMPTLPVRENTKLSLNNLYFEFDNGAAVQGSQIDWSLTDLTGGAVLSKNDNTVTIFNNGKLEKLFELEASYNGLEKTFYIFVPDSNGEYEIYSKTFSSEDLEYYTDYGSGLEFYTFTPESEWKGDSYIAEDHPDLLLSGGDDGSYIGNLSTIKWDSSYGGIVAAMSKPADSDGDGLEWTNGAFWTGDYASGTVYLDPNSENGKFVSTFKNVVVDFTVMSPTANNWARGDVGPIARFQVNEDFMNNELCDWVTDSYDSVNDGYYAYWGEDEDGNVTRVVEKLPYNDRISTTWKVAGTNLNTSLSVNINGKTTQYKRSDGMTVAAVPQEFVFQNNKAVSTQRLKVVNDTVEAYIKAESEANFNKGVYTMTDAMQSAVKNTTAGTIGYVLGQQCRAALLGAKVSIVATEEDMELIAKYSEELVGVYSVPANKPALPTVVDAAIDLTNIFFEFDNGMLVSGNDITWTSLDTGAYADNNAKTVTKLNKTTSTIKASYNGDEKLIYLVTANANGEYELYNHKFSNADIDNDKFAESSDWTTNLVDNTVSGFNGGYGIFVAAAGAIYIKPESDAGKMIANFDDITAEVTTRSIGIQSNFVGPFVRADLGENGTFDSSDSQVWPGILTLGSTETRPSWMRIYLDGSTRIDAGDGYTYAKVDGKAFQHFVGYYDSSKHTKNINLTHRATVKGTQLSVQYKETDLISGNTVVTDVLNIAKPTTGVTKGGVVGFRATDMRNACAVDYKVIIEFSEEFLENVAGDTSKVSLIPANKPAIPMSIGQTLDLSLVTLTDEFGNLIDGSKAAWTISDESAYLVYDETTNTVTSFSAGYATLTATYAGNSAKIYVTVANSKGEYVLYQHSFSAGDLKETGNTYTIGDKTKKHYVFTEESEWYAKGLAADASDDKLGLGYRNERYDGNNHYHTYPYVSAVGDDGWARITKEDGSKVNLPVVYYLRPDSASGIKVSSFADLSLSVHYNSQGNNDNSIGVYLRSDIAENGRPTNYVSAQYYQRNSNSVYGTWLRISDETTTAKYSEIKGSYNSEIGNHEGIRLSDGTLHKVGLFQELWATYTIKGTDTLKATYATDANYSDAVTISTDASGVNIIEHATGVTTPSPTGSKINLEKATGGTIVLYTPGINPTGYESVKVTLDFTADEMAYLSKFVDEYAEVKVNEYEDITEYVGGSTNIAPQAPYNKVFAGWYYDEACTAPVKEEDNYTGKAYAKFVNSDIFSVKWQITNPADAARGGKVDLRLVTSVDSLRYQEVAFEIIRENGTKRQRASIKTNEVFEHIVGNGDNFEAYDPTVFTDISKYFATGRVKNTNWADWGEGTYYVTVVLTTVDGTVVRNTNATHRFKMSYDDQAIDMAEAALKAQINNLPDTVEANATGNKIYISNSGSDSYSGTKDRPVKTFARAYALASDGDTILFQRGGTYRMSYLQIKKQVSIGAYGTGAKPMILGSADVKSTLTAVDSFQISATDTKQEGLNTELFTAPVGTKLYKVNLSGKLATDSDVGSIFFVEEGDKVTAADKKWFRSADHGLYDPQFDDLTEAYDFFYDFNNKVAYVLLPEDKTPADYEAIEALGLENVFICAVDGITIENLAIRYGNFGVVVYYVDNTTLRGLEIGWIGGNRQSNLGKYNLETHGSQYVRLGNGIENWGGGSNFTIDQCYVYECYDAGITFQNNTNKGEAGYQYYQNSEFKNIKFTNNLLTRNIYNIEYFQSHENAKDDTFIKNVLFEGNICRDAGGTAEDPMWASLYRPDKKVATNIKGSTALGNHTMLTNDPEAWLNGEEADYTLEAKEGYVSSFIIRNNIFDGSYDNSIMHFSAANKGGEPVFNNNLVIGNGDQTITVQGKAYTIKNFMNKFDTAGGSVVKSSAMASAVYASARTFSTWGAVKETNTLDNTKYLLEEKKSIKVGYIGGSVTDGTNAYNWVEDGNYTADNDSWRALTTKWLQDNYSDASVVEIMASQGGTASYWGFHRLETDLLVYKPDLVFVEFGVNDGYSGLTGTDSALYMEGIVRKLRTANPNVDIVFVIVADSTNYKADSDGIKAHYAVANHYGIPVIDVRNSLAADYDLSDKAVWDTFFSDSVHPSKAGYAAYAGYVAEAMEGFLADAEANFQEVTMPTTDYVSNLATTSEFRKMNKVTIEDKDGKAIALSSAEGTRLKKVDEVAMLYDGDVIKTSFTGKTLGFYLDSYGTELADGSKVSFTINIDGKTTVVAPQYKGGYNLEYIALDNLAPGKHTVEITINSTDLNPIAIGALLIAK